MSISTKLSADQNTVTIAIDGKFDFNVHKDFRRAYQQVDGDDARYVIDMSRVTYMDSSALGMLLILREKAGGDDGEVTIQNCNEEITRILTVSNFHKLFKIV